MRQYTIHIGAKSFDVSLVERMQSEVHFLCNGEHHVVTVTPKLAKHQSSQEPSVRAPIVQRPTSLPASAGDIVSPMPGIVVQLPVTVGASVAAGQTVAVIEAMKMENNITSPISGTVLSISTEVGKEVPGGSVLLKIKPA